MAPLCKKAVKLWRYKNYRIRTGTKWNTMGIHSTSPSMTASLDELELNRHREAAYVSTYLVCWINQLRKVSIE